MSPLSKQRDVREAGRMRVCIEKGRISGRGLRQIRRAESGANSTHTMKHTLLRLAAVLGLVAVAAGLSSCCVAPCLPPPPCGVSYAPPAPPACDYGYGGGHGGYGHGHITVGHHWGRGRRSGHCW